MMRRCFRWLETHWVLPAYSGWLMAGLAIFFFGAATNTMAGWLYVISGVMLALLGIGAFLPARSLRELQVSRREITPVSKGEALTIELCLTNQSRQTQTLLQLRDELPVGLGKPVEQAIEQVAAQGTYIWIYQQPTQRRGIYRWQTVGLRTAAPLGLFWCQRSQVAKAIAIVYPTVLPLSHCPLVDQIGRDLSLQLLSATQAQAATEGLTRTLRPYRWGDSTRLIHWKTSARYGELRVRELETHTGGQELVIGLDSRRWHPEDFEQAVVAAASLYFYACRRHLRVSLWTADRDRVQGDRAVLEALAAAQVEESQFAPPNSPPNLPLLWLTQNPDRLSVLPVGSRWLLWSSSEASTPIRPSLPHSGRLIQSDQPLQLQLELPLEAAL
jgi:uncharacterized protein (DUF58 family)